MKYEQLVDRYWRAYSDEVIKLPETALYFALVEQWHRQGENDVTNCSFRTICLMIRLPMKKISPAVFALVSKGLIECTIGEDGISYKFT